MNKFYDTSSLLLKADNLFDEGKIILSSITLNELEEIKTSANKDSDIKMAARRVLQQLNDNPDKFELFIFKPSVLEPIYDAGLPINNDTRILACAIYIEKNSYPDDLIFVTNDLSLAAMANLFFGADSIHKCEVEEDDYCGYKEIVMHDKAMERFYSSYSENLYNLNINEYLIIKNMEGEIVDRLCWTGKEYRHINFANFNSKWFGEVKPIKGDVYQMMAADSLTNNRITMLKGPAGTGKTYLALAYLLYLLDKNKISKIIIFCNTVATKNSAKLGFYPGSRDEKLLDSQIGNLLSSKLGDKVEVERMIEDGKLVLLPMSDIRGYDTSGMKAGVYISEAQNLDIALMKLALQRIGEDSFCIIDGDPLAQVDDISFAGSNNGMRRASKVFRGTRVYGEVELKNIYRSEIAAIAQRM